MWMAKSGAWHPALHRFCRAHNEESRERQDARRRQGMCPLCGKRKPARGKHHCTRCLARARNDNERYRYGAEVSATRGDMERNPIRVTPWRRYFAPTSDGLLCCKGLSCEVAPRQTQLFLVFIFIIISVINRFTFSRCWPIRGERNMVQRLFLFASMLALLGLPVCAQEKKAPAPSMLLLGMSAHQARTLAGAPDSRDPVGVVETWWYYDSTLTFTRGKLTGWSFGPSGVSLPAPVDPCVHTPSNYAVTVHGEPDEIDAAPSQSDDLPPSASVPRSRYARGPYTSRVRYVAPYTRRDGTPVRGYYRRSR